MLLIALCKLHDNKHDENEDEQQLPALVDKITGSFSSWCSGILPRNFQHSLACGLLRLPNSQLFFFSPLFPALLSSFLIIRNICADSCGFTCGRSSARCYNEFLFLTVTQPKKPRQTEKLLMNFALFWENLLFNSIPISRPLQHEYLSSLFCPYGFFPFPIFW